MTKKALITGITGQDGHYLAELLLSKGYEVYGLVRRLGETREPWADGITYLNADVRDQLSVNYVIKHVEPDELYHLASQSHVAYSFNRAEETYRTNIDGTLHVLNAAVTMTGTKVYFAGTSEMYGNPSSKPQDEDYPMKPASPYGVSKLSGYWSSKVYRESYDMHVSCGILFNHESVIRPKTFVTRKITLGIKEYIDTGRQFWLGNLDAKKDWGWAPEYVNAMWRMLSTDKSDDYVIATGEQHSVREFLEYALKYAGIEFTVNETTEGVKYKDTSKTQLPTIVAVNKALFRPNDAQNYMGDASKAKRELGWEPTSYFNDVVRMMVDHDINGDAKN